MESEVVDALIKGIVTLDDAAATALVLSHSGAVNVAGDRGRWTPLTAATWFGKCATLGALQRRGADPYLEDRYGISALCMAAGIGNGSLQAMVALFPNIDPSRTQRSGRWTPLHVAAINGAEENARLLIQLGARVDAKDERGATPAQAARAKGFPALASLISRAVRSRPPCCSCVCRRRRRCVCVCSHAVPAAFTAGCVASSRCHRRVST
jgi:ankyrin repeat protein